jgi:hypothetical protein
MAIAPFGCAALWRSHRKTLLGLLVAPAACTMVASALHKYPFSDRLVIFLIPTAILLVAAGFEGFLRWLPARWIWIAPVLLAALLTEPAIVNVKAAVHRPLKEEMKPALVSLKHRLHRGDAVYVYFRGRPAYEYYAPLLDFEPTRIYLGNRAEGATSVIADLAPLKGIPRVWILRHTSNGTAESNLLFALNGMAVPLADQVEARHVRADLYDFSRAP